MTNTSETQTRQLKFEELCNDRFKDDEMFDYELFWDFYLKPQCVKSGMTEDEVEQEFVTFSQEFCDKLTNFVNNYKS